MASRDRNAEDVYLSDHREGLERGGDCFESGLFGGGGLEVLVGVQQEADGALWAGQGTREIRVERGTELIECSANVLLLVRRCTWVDVHDDAGSAPVHCCRWDPFRPVSSRLRGPVPDRRVYLVYLGTTKAPPERGLDACDLDFRLVETRGIEPLTSTLQRRNGGFDTQDASE